MDESSRYGISSAILGPMLWVLLFVFAMSVAGVSCIAAGHFLDEPMAKTCGIYLLCAIPVVLAVLSAMPRNAN